MSDGKNNTNKIREVLKSLRSNIFQKGDEDRIDRIRNVDKVLTKLSNKFINKDFKNYSDMIRKVMSDNITSDLFKEESIAGILQSIDTAGRFDRYENSDEIVVSIPFCARALKVLADGVVSPDNITKDVIQIINSKSERDEEKSALSELQNIRERLDMDDIIMDAVYETLKYGDHFIEICDYRSEEIPITQLMLNEGTITKEDASISLKYNYKPFNYNSPGDSYERTENIVDTIIKEQFELTERDTDNEDVNEILTPLHKNIYDRNISIKIVEDSYLGDKIEDEYSSHVLREESDQKVDLDTAITELTNLSETDFITTDRFDNKSKNKEDEELTNATIDNIKLVSHDPRRVLKIQSRKFKMNLGYLILPENVSAAGSNINTYKPLGFSGGEGGEVGFDLQTMDELYLKLIKVIEKHVSNTKGDVSFDKEELKKILKRAIADVERESSQMLTGGQSSREMNIRYVPPDRMEHFEVNSKTFFPYGESIFFKSTFQAKLLIALETAVTIRRMSDSTDKRLIYIELNSARAVRNQIESVKESLKRRKHSVDSFGNIGSIPSMVTSYEDYYIPQNNGKRYVEFDTLNPSVQIQQVVDELKFFRDMVVSSLEVPPAFINLEENLCLSYSTDTVVCCDNTIRSIKEIEEMLKNGEDVWVYSYDHDKGVVFPNKVMWAGMTRPQAEVVRVWTDNDEFVDMTPDHPVMLRDGSYRQAKDLKPNDSLMPLYRKPTKSRATRYKNGNHTFRGKYMDVYNPGIDKWELEYVQFAKYCNLLEENSGHQIHHINHIPEDNRPINLIALTKEQHMTLHGKDAEMTDEELNSLIYNRDRLLELTLPGNTTLTKNCIQCNTEFQCTTVQDVKCCSKECEIIRRKISGSNSQKVQKEKNKDKYKFQDFSCFYCAKPFIVKLTKNKIKRYIENITSVKMCSECSKNLQYRAYNTALGKTNGKRFCEIDIKTCDICLDKFVYSESKTREEKVYKNVCYNMNCVNTHRARISAEIRSQKLKGRKYNVKDKFLPPYQESAILNHKVVKVEYLSEPIDTGDITVEKHSNFAVSAGYFVHNSNKSALSHESSLFAETILSYQKALSKHLRSIFAKIYFALYKKKFSKAIVITFPPPRMLQIEKESEHYDIVSRIIETLKAQGIPEEYLKQKYLSLDWEEIEAHETKEKIKKGMEPIPDEDDMMGGMGGGFGGGMGGIPPMGGGTGGMTGF